MRELVAAILASLLGAIALLHASWAVGALWPGKSEADLIAKAIGDGRRHMPSRPVIWLVAGLIGIAAVWPLLLVMRPPPPLAGAVIRLGGGVLALVFLARGGAGYAPAWRQAHPVEPFARLDRSFYSPLCLAVGSGLAYLVLGGLA